ncbi:rhamnan synthesis F family protein [Streptococcus plurextorum]|uniref:rhamnan synthesis F family protein n=1 Tax=Streptococcus plurextorum TaxID=456876 RepID=UPI0003FA4229|nr:rhamnan synthesis F family protein [Streptococcus plurextorum]
MDNKDLQKEYETLTRKYQLLEEDYQWLLEQHKAVENSLSFKLGNSIVHTLKSPIFLLRNPAILKRRFKSLLKRISRISINPKYIYLKAKRTLQRPRLSGKNINRTLIYVIYGSDEQIAPYKIRFLESLLPLMSHVITVVNGTLSQKDMANLSMLGEVILRENKGYDVAAFREGILSIKKEDIEQIDELVLVNDTNIGPFADWSTVFSKMEKKRLDFWGISFGEYQEDLTKYNPYGYIPKHLQSYFMVINKGLLKEPLFREYWENLTDTNSRDKAIGKHETYFTKYFQDLGYRAGALLTDTKDSAMYLYPLKLLKQGSPLIKYSALANYDEEQLLWHGLDRKSEIPKLIKYIESNTDYPVEIIHAIIEQFKDMGKEQYILIIDGVEDQIPQCTRYRVTNKAEQLRSFGFDVRIINHSDFQISEAKYASHVIIYRAPYSDQLKLLRDLCIKSGKKLLFDIDDLVFDTVYTDQLTYTKTLSVSQKSAYDASVNNYGKMLALCDVGIASTTMLKQEMKHYLPKVLLNRNLVSKELFEVSRLHVKDYTEASTIVKIGYFSGSIAHNENFELIKPAIVDIMKKYPNVELHIVGHLDLPSELLVFSNRIINHPYVDWKKLPELIASVDINLAPLVSSIFNNAKSNIKFLEASLVKVPTIASRVGDFAEYIIDGETGVLVSDSEWFVKLEMLVASSDMRQNLASQAYENVLANHMIDGNEDELVRYLLNDKI